MSSKNIKLVIVFFVYFLLSLLFSEYYVDGDQARYIQYYTAMSHLSFIDGYDARYQFISGEEPVYYCLVWLASKILSKSVFMSIVNGVLASLAYIWLRRAEAYKVIYWLMLPNFYLWVLFLAAERFKFGALFFLIAVVFYSSKNYIARLILLLLSVLSHFQMFVALLLMFAKSFLNWVRYIMAGKILNKNSWWVFLIVILASLFFLTSYHLSISNKGAIYMTIWGDNVVNILKPTIFFIAALLCVPRKWYEITSIFIPLIVFCYLLGGDRLVIFAYFIFIFYGLQYNRGMNFFVLSSSTYFAIVGIIFLYNVVCYGNGFAIVQWSMPLSAM